MPDVQCSAGKLLREFSPFVILNVVWILNFHPSRAFCVIVLKPETKEREDFCILCVYGSKNKEEK